MDDQIRIPCVMMRGGTSRGPFFLASDLPANPTQRDAVLLSVIGNILNLTSVISVYLNAAVQGFVIIIVAFLQRRK